MELEMGPAAASLGRVSMALGLRSLGRSGEPRAWAGTVRPVSALRAMTLCNIYNTMHGQVRNNVLSICLCIYLSICFVKEHF